VDVRSTDAGRLDADHDLTRPRSEVRGVDLLQRLAVLDDRQGAHSARLRPKRYAEPVNQQFSDILEAAQSRTLNVRTADGHPLIKTKLLHAAAAAVVGVMIAPRLTAAAAIAAMFKGVTVSVEKSGDRPVAA
jgi:hypothetical protein